MSSDEGMEAQRTSFSVQRSPPLPAAVTGLRALFSVGEATSLGALCAGAWPAPFFVVRHFN